MIARELETTQQAQQIADDAMYQVKKNGKSDLQVFTVPPTTHKTSTESE